MKKYTILLTKQAVKDISTLSPKLVKKLWEILDIVIAVVPHSGKKLVGDMQGFYSFRLNLKDRIVYSVDDEKGIVYVRRARTHYGK